MAPRKPKNTTQNPAVEALLERYKNIEAEIERSTDIITNYSRAVTNHQAAVEKFRVEIAALEAAIVKLQGGAA